MSCTTTLRAHVGAGDGWHSGTGVLLASRCPPGPAVPAVPGPGAALGSHIPNLTAPSVGICMNLSTRMKKNWQFIFFQSPGGRRSVRRACPTQQKTGFICVIALTTDTKPCPLMPESTALLKAAFQSFFQNQTEKSCSISVRMLWRSASPAALQAQPLSPKESVSLSTLRLCLSLTNHGNKHLCIHFSRKTTKSVCK